MVADGQLFLIAKGGQGGRGNAAFKTHANTAPHISEKGAPGQEVTAALELKVLADIGLVGFPNAGKSTFLSVISNARPKIAAYPFTTLSPNLGIIGHKGKSFAVADIPGLIEGAHEGKGLGHEFLRHLERTRVLVHLVDPLGFDGEDAVSSVKLIEAELKSYSPLLVKKPRLLVVNKSDLPEAEDVFRALKKKYRKHKVLLMSAATRKGVSAVLDELIRLLNKIPPPQAEPEAPQPAPEFKPLFSIRRTPAGVLEVHGGEVDRLAAITNFNQPESLIRFRNILKKIGVDRALRKLGIVVGQTVVVAGREYEWVEPQDPVVFSRPVRRRRR